MSTLVHDLAVLPPCNDHIRILRRDDAFLIIDKPARLLSVPGRHPLNDDTVIARLRIEFPTAEIVHRLDFDTSGIMIIPLNKASLSHISQQFQGRKVFKTYTAMVNGLVKNDSGIINLPIAADMQNRPKYKICDSGKNSITEFKVIARNELNNSTCLLLHPITGRSHQLRLHMEAMGHPILGCDFYGTFESREKAGRLLLHASEVQFQHPVTNEMITETCSPNF